MGLPKRTMGPEWGHKGAQTWGQRGPTKLAAPVEHGSTPKDQSGAEEKPKFWIQPCALVSPFVPSV